MKSTQESLPTGYLELLLRKRYSESTINTYTRYFRQFVMYFKEMDITIITHDQINEYILKLIEIKKISPSQQNQRINAIKFYYEQVLGRKRKYYRVNRPKKEKYLPTVLTREEVERIFSLTKNQKHRCILMTIYSGGLRRSELLNLRVEDIDSKRMLIKICGSKGNKDRFTLLSDRLVIELREYYKVYQPKLWLFEGQKG
jgi:integrase/recombinase XerD